MELALKSQRRLMSALLLCTGLVAAGSVSAQELTADGKVRCTIATAEQMTSVEEICECQVVTRGMLSYLRRQEDFATILEQTNEMCPALASVLADVPVAATPTAPQEDGGGGSTRSSRSDGDDDDGTGTGGGDDDGTGTGGGGDDDDDNGNGTDGDDSDDGNRGHGNDPDGVDEDNPGKSSGRNPNSMKFDDCDGDGNRGHGNDPDGVDEDNPGKSTGTASADEAPETAECDEDS